MKGRISLILAGVIIGTFMISPASADFRKSISHIINHAKGTFYTKGQSNDRFLNYCDAQYDFYPDHIMQIVAQALVDADAATGSYTTGPADMWLDCTGMSSGVAVKKESTGIFRVAFPGFFTFETFDDDLVMAQVTVYGTDGSASYRSIAEDDVGYEGTVVEVHVRNGAGAYADLDFNLAVHGWLTDFFAARTAARNGSTVSGYTPVPRT